MLNKLFKLLFRLIGNFCYFGSIITVGAFAFGLIPLMLGNVKFPDIVVYAFSTGSVIGGLCAIASTLTDDDD